MSIYNRRLPLYNLLAEKIILGFLLSNLSLKAGITDSLNSYFFSLKKHRLLYLYLTKIKTKDQNLYVIQIIRKLWRTTFLKEIGGVYYIIKNIQKSHSFNFSDNSYKNLRYFLNILYYYYVKRVFVQYSYEVITLNYFYHLSNIKIYQQTANSLYKVSLLNKVYQAKHSNKHVNNLINKVKESAQMNSTLLSGFRDLDKIIQGFRIGDLIIIAGRPSMGKTSFAINIIYNLALKLKIKVHMFSLEMSKIEILYKLLALISKINIYEIENNIINKQKWELLQKSGQVLMESPLCIDDNGHSSIGYITTQCKNCNLDNSLIIIDYLQLISTESRTSENRSQELGNITRELKLLAQTLKTTIIVLSQLNRNIENRTNKRPLLSDLRESGCISFSTLPDIQKKNKSYQIKILHCFKQYYLLNQSEKVQFDENKEQYIFSLIDLTHLLLCTTHNHKVLTYHTWEKEDQIKNSKFCNLKRSFFFNSQTTLEIYKAFQIKCLGKSEVYDISLQKYHNFIIKDYIVHNSIEQDADLVLMLYKDETNKNHRIIDIVIAKHRHGPIGAFQLLFHANVCKFKDIENKKLFSQLPI